MDLWVGSFDASFGLDPKIAILAWVWLAIIAALVVARLIQSDAARRAAVVVTVALLGFGGLVKFAQWVLTL